MAYYPDFPTVDDAGQGFGFTPQQMMLLGLSQGLLQAGSPSARPVGIGGALGSGIQGALSGQAQAQAMINQGIKNKQAQQMIDLEGKKVTQAQQAIDKENERAALLKPIMERFMAAQAASNPMSPNAPNPSVMAGSGTTTPPVQQGGGFPLNPNEIAALKLGGGPDLLPNYEASQPKLQIGPNGVVTDIRTGQVVGTQPVVSSNGQIALLNQGPGGTWNAGPVPGASDLYMNNQIAEQAARAAYTLQTIQPTGPNQPPRISTLYNVAVGAGAPHVIGATRGRDWVSGGGGVPSGLTPDQEATQAGRVQARKGDADTVAKYKEKLPGMASSLTSLEYLNSLNADDKTYAGGAAEFKKELSRVAQGLGINVGNVKAANTEMYIARIGELLKERLASKDYGSGSGVSNLDLITGNVPLPDLAKTRQGRQQIIDALKKDIMRSYNDVRSAADFYDERGSLSGFKFPSEASIPRPAIPKTPASSGENQFSAGQVYTDSKGVRARYLGNGKWQEIR